LTDTLFFDTDCLSAFLWVNDQSLLAELYSGKIVIPKQVYDELSNPRVTHLKARIDTLLLNSDAELATILMGTEEYALYRTMTDNPEPGHIAIGKGEASALAMAKVRGGIVASNNLRDVKAYVKEFGLKLVTTGDILKEALEKGLISEEEGNSLWKDMLKKRRKLGYNSFSEFLETTL